MDDLEEIIDENPQSIEKPKVKRVMSDAQKEALCKGRERKAELAKMNNAIIDDVVQAKMLPKITRKKKGEIMSKLKDESNKPVPAPSPVKPVKVKKVKKIIEVVEESSDEEVVIEKRVRKPKKVEPIQEIPKIPRLIRL